MKIITSVYDLPFEQKEEDLLRLYLTFYRRDTLHIFGGVSKLSEGGFLYFMINGCYPTKKFYAWQPIYAKGESNYILLEGKKSGKVTFGFAIKIPNLMIYLSNYNNKILATNISNLHQLYQTKKVKFLENLEPIYNKY